MYVRESEGVERDDCRKRKAEDAGMMQSTLQAHVTSKRFFSCASGTRSKVEESPVWMTMCKRLLIFKGLLAPWPRCPG